MENLNQAGDPAHTSTTQAPVRSKSILEDADDIGGTQYDLQTNGSCQNRLYIYEDGSKGGVWTMGNGDFTDRGTGYNYSDGNAWGPYPTARIESIRTGWPSYAPLGENGELTSAHTGDGHVMFETRATKGTGAWTEFVLAGPNPEGIFWPRTITAGENHSVIHNLAVTYPIANGGTLYEGMDGAPVYSRSIDGGLTWDPQTVILDDLSSDHYLGFRGDNYSWAVSGEDNIAFTIGESWQDLVLMKSTNGGDDWDKTVIWEHPYPFWSYSEPIATDTFYCVDGSHHLDFDSQGKVHVVFGINRAISDGTASSWYPYVGGIGYWNEDMPSFSDGHHALDPFGHPESELVEDYNFIGWSQDMDGDGVLTFVSTAVEGIGLYYQGLSTMPQILIGEQDEIYVIWSSVTETYNTLTQNYRHLWGRGYYDGAWSDFQHITSNIIYSFDESVFPSIAPYTGDDYIHFIYQADDEPGLHVRGDEDQIGNNTIRYMMYEKDSIVYVPVGIHEDHAIFNENNVSQNSPNPFSGITYVNVQLDEASDVLLEVSNIAGQVVYTTSKGLVQPGSLQLEINATDLTAGLYFYTVKAGSTEVTKKMIVR
jgi:hypothetical protein